MRNQQINGVTFALFYVPATGVALVFAAMWCMSPLGIGFADAPTEPAMKALFDSVYQGSYWIGIPLLLAGQVISLAIALIWRSRAAYYVPLITIGLFSLSAAAVLAMIGH